MVGHFQRSGGTLDNLVVLSITSSADYALSYHSAIFFPPIPSVEGLFDEVVKSPAASVVVV